MSLHAPDYIVLLQSTHLDKKSIISKFSQLLDDILVQFKEDHFDEIIPSIIKAVPGEALLGLIDGAIMGKCKLLKVPSELTGNQFADYVPKIFAGLTLNEQFYILAHMNLALINPRVDQPNPVFANLIYSIIRKELT